MARHYISAITDATTLGTEEEDEVIDALALLGPKKCLTLHCAQLTVDYMKLELDMHVCAGYPLQDTVLVQLHHSLNEILLTPLLSLSPKKTLAPKGASQASDRTSSKSNLSVDPVITPPKASGKRLAHQREYGIIIMVMPTGIAPEDIRSFLRLLAKKTNSALDPWANAAEHNLERTSTLASPYIVITVNDPESAETFKDVLSLLNNTTAGVIVLHPLNNRWQQWLREGGNLEITVQNTEQLPLELSMTKLPVETSMSGTADDNVFYFVCPPASCTLLKFDSFKEVNMHIIEKHSTEDGDNEFPKAKKMKKKVATAEVGCVVVRSQRIVFAVAQRAAEGATSVTPVTISVKTEGASTSKPAVHPAHSLCDADMSEKADDDEDYFQPVTNEMEEDSFFEFDNGTLQLLEQSGQNSTKQEEPSIIFTLESIMSADPKYAKFFTGAKKLHAATPTQGLPYISVKIINSPKNKWNKEPNEAIYLNMVLLSQPLLSKKGAVSLTIYHMKNPNGLQPQPTFKWCILSYKVVFDTTDHAQAAYAAVSAEQTAKSGLAPVTSIMRDHNNEVASTNFQRRTSFSPTGT